MIIIANDQDAIFLRLKDTKAQCAKTTSHALIHCFVVEKKVLIETKTMLISHNVRTGDGLHFAHVLPLRVSVFCT